MRVKITVSALMLLMTLFSASCKHDHYRVNISSVNVKVRINRLEKDLFTLNPDQIVTSVPALKNKYANFLQLFSMVINAGDIKSQSFGESLLQFCSDKQNNEVYAAVMKKYPGVEKIENDLSDAFRHYYYYMPGKRIPAVYTCITGFNNSIIAGDSALGISLDRYLGADCEYYPRLQIYKYISDRMTPENIVPDCIYGWCASEWDFRSVNYRTDNVLSEIIHEGKLKYFEKSMLPDTPDDIIFGFTKPQMKFCRNNEEQMWQYLVENNLLFNTDQFTIRKLTGEAPFTTCFSKESPGRAAIWIGFRIVESYMTRNPKVSMEDMIRDSDFQGILEKAKYNPR